MHGAARATLAVHARLGRGQQALDLAELRVGELQLRRAASEHVEPVVIADRHLVRQAAEVPRQLGDALGELVTAAKKGKKHSSKKKASTRKK